MRKTGTIAALLSMIAAVPVAIAGVAQLMSYSPWDNPGALGRGAWLVGTAAVLFLVPAISVIAILAVHDIRAYAAWKRTLTPGQRLMVSLAETAAMEAGHVAFRDHNRKVGAELTAKVMGGDGA